jgi:hypothetical protein
MPATTHWVSDYQTCTHCEHWPHCRWIIYEVERGAGIGEDIARAANGTSAPLRGFVPLCETRDNRKDKA